MAGRPVALLLPGMDGTGALFGNVIRALGAQFQPVPVRYSTSDPQSYDELVEVVSRALPAVPFVLVAESFSGPVAVRIAARAPAGLAAIVLVASFVTSPVPWLSPLLARALASAVFRVTPSDAAIRHFLLGGDCPPELLDDVRTAMSTVAPAVLARRLEAIVRVDAAEDLLRCTAPLLVITAADDRLLPRRALRTMQAIRPDLTHVSIPGPHLLLQRSAEAVAAAITTFVAARTDAFGHP